MKEINTRAPQRRARVEPRQGLSPKAIVALLLLLAIPGIAVSRLSPAINWRILIGAPLLASSIAFFTYRYDKRRAQNGDWRVPESTLHLLSVFAGWPGAFLAQRVFRHKTSKKSFLIVFWGTVLAYQVIAFDSLAGWRLSTNAWHFIHSQFESRMGTPGKSKFNSSNERRS